MTTPEQPEPQIYQPTPVQLERALALRRFNRRYIYLPVGVFSLLALALVGLMLWGVLSPNVSGTRAFVSGLADLVVILTVMPLMLLCAIVPAAAFGLMVYRRQQPQREHGRLQTLIWRIETFITKTQNTASNVTGKTASPLIKAHSRAAYIRALLQNLKQQFTRR